jgi:glycosyltransferase involved in cell wall biosynthesis
MYKVLIIQAEIKHYRVPFYNALYAELQRDQIQLTVAYSNSHPVDALQGDRAELPPPIGKRVRGNWFFGRLLYQPVWKEIFQADLVIVGPEIKFLINPVLLLMSRLGMKTIAFWGLGPNKRPNRSPLAETIKRQFFTWVDWWFAYTQFTADYLRSEGMPGDRITDVQNASDSKEFRKLVQEIGQQEVLAAKLALTGSTESQIGLYCGVVAEIKALPLLLDTARQVKQRCPAFHLVVVGSGPMRPWLEGEIVDAPWIHYLGSKFGRENALYFKMADAFLLAGTAGLAVVDCFAAGLPMLATDLLTHPPEISYLVDGHNGLLAPHEAGAFAALIVEVLSNPTLNEKLRNGARESGSRYTMEAMVQNFRSGVKRCLLSSGVMRGAAADLAATEGQS